MAQYSKPLDEVISELHSSRSEGLSGAQAEERLAQYGPNRLRAKKKKSNLQRFLEQFKDVMILILIAAAVVSFIVACNGHDTSEFFEPLLILVIVILNAVMGMVQESKAEKAKRCRVCRRPMQGLSVTGKSCSLTPIKWFPATLYWWKQATISLRMPG